MTSAIPEFFLKGGPVMWALLLCSIAALAVTLERLWALRRARVLSVPLTAELQRPADKAETIKRLRGLAEGDRTGLGELIRVAVHNDRAPKADNLEAIQNAARRVTSKMERGLTTLALVVELGPLLGLLGAVSGMVRVFGDVAKHGLSDPSLISAGISEALIATFTGLSISIPALVAYMYFRRYIDTLCLEMDGHVDGLLQKMYR